jgi:hypothetical protein
MQSCTCAQSLGGCRLRFCVHVQDSRSLGTPLRARATANPEEIRLRSHPVDGQAYTDRHTSTNPINLQGLVGMDLAAFKAIDYHFRCGPDPPGRGGRGMFGADISLGTSSVLGRFRPGSGGLMFSYCLLALSAAGSIGSPVDVEPS